MGVKDYDAEDFDILKKLPQIIDKHLITLHIDPDKSHGQYLNKTFEFNDRGI